MEKKDRPSGGTPPSAHDRIRAVETRPTPTREVTASVVKRLEELGASNRLVDFAKKQTRER